MKIRCTIVLLLVTLVSYGQTQSECDIIDNFVRDDLGIFLEKKSPNDNDPNRYTIDNSAYIINRKFVFDYYIIRKGDTLKIKAPQNHNPEIDFQREWGFISRDVNDIDKIKTISLTVLPGVSNTNQTMVKYEYQHVADVGLGSFSSTSGVIENGMNTWMHPHRDKYFMILELNPFPYIQKPFKVGNKWKWKLEIGDHWSDEHWETWNGSIQNSYEYEITGKKKLKTQIGELDCWVINGKATSSIGSTALVAYYNEANGFVKLDYTNIDKSRLVIDIKKIK